MGNSLGGLLGGNSGNQQGNSLSYGSESQCCNGVVDPISLFSTIGALAAASLFLRQAVIDNMIMGMTKRKKRRSTFQQDLKQDLKIATQQGTLTYFSFFSTFSIRNC